MTASESGPKTVALAFAQALVQGKFDQAQRFLAPELQGQYSPDQLRITFEEMIAYGDGAPTEVEVMTTLANWPDKQPEDLEWVYISIAGDGYGEAVTVIVRQDLLIRSLEWGRP